MRYVLFSFGKEQRLDLPEGYTFTSIPKTVKTEQGEMALYSIEVFNEQGASAAVFTGAIAFYPESFIPKKNEFVDKIPNNLGWINPA